jgi:hypothetical protein
VTFDSGRRKRRSRVLRSMVTVTYQGVTYIDASSAWPVLPDKIKANNSNWSVRLKRLGFDLADCRFTSKGNIREPIVEADTKKRGVKSVWIPIDQWTKNTRDAEVEADAKAVRVAARLAKEAARKVAREAVDDEAGEGAVDTVRAAAAVPDAIPVNTVEEQRATEKLLIRRVPRGQDYAGYGSILDAIRLVTGRNAPGNDAGKVWRKMLKRNAFVHALDVRQRPLGQKQQMTPVASSSDMLKIVMQIGGVKASNLREQHNNALRSLINGATHADAREHDALMAAINVNAQRKPRSGLLYTVTSPLVDLVKVGLWAG